MVTDYISREAALVYAPLPKYLREYQTQNLDDAWEDGYFCALDQVRSIPAADVRPVVLCKDCKHGQGEKMDFWNEYEGIECIGGIVHRKDWFCADGVKREES